MYKNLKRSFNLFSALEQLASNLNTYKLTGILNTF